MTIKSKHGRITGIDPFRLPPSYPHARPRSRRRRPMAVRQATVEMRQRLINAAFGTAIIGLWATVVVLAYHVTNL